MKKVLLATFESLPFIKTGGLADVCYALPKSINSKKYNVKVVLPLHLSIKEKYQNELKYLTSFDVLAPCFNLQANVYSYFVDKVEYYFIENETYFNRNDVYGYHDDKYRFSFFCLAVIEMLKKLEYYPDIIQSNDYHTALIPAFCKLQYKKDKNIKKIKHIFTIHNLMYQGHYDKSLLFELGFKYKDYSDGLLRFNDECNLMKIGIVCADKILTVSKTYAKEILNPEYGNGLDVILRYRKDDLIGITNGIDIDLFNPKKDPYLYQNYDVSSFIKGKKANRDALLKELKLADDDSMVLGIITRMTYQKGLDLILSNIHEILRRNVKLLIIGSGESKYEYAFKILEKEYKKQVRYIGTYDEKMAHRVYAAADLFLMPSLFEPCGLSQMIAMHYGTLPLVRETGGLLETVKPYNEYEKNGWGFSFRPYNSYDFMIVFNYAYKTYFKNRKDFKMLIKSAMKYDVSFGRVKADYENLYKEMVGD